MVYFSLSPSLNYELFRGCFHRSITLKTSRRSFVGRFHASRSETRQGKGETKRETKEITRNQGFVRRSKSGSMANIRRESWLSFEDGDIRFKGELLSVGD